MEKKGFTLVELLGVIIILTLLVLLVFPNIINSVKSSSTKTNKLTEDLIYRATDLFIEKNNNYFPKLKGNKYVVTLEELVEEGLLKSPIKYDDYDDITSLKCVQIVYNGKFEYNLQDDCEYVYNGFDG